MFRTVAEVQSMSPQKTEDCWVMRSEQKVSPTMSMTYLARSLKSMRRAMRSIFKKLKAETLKF
jgi:hypothetical protein